MPDRFLGQGAGDSRLAAAENDQGDHPKRGRLGENGQEKKSLRERKGLMLSLDRYSLRL
jgi:hypothetical protein